MSALLLAIVPVVAVVLYLALGVKVGRRNPTVGAAAEASVPRGAAEAVWRRHQKPTRLMDRWYQAQPSGQKRNFVEAVRLRGRAPTPLELQCALTRVAAKHPTLLLLPHPEAYHHHSQLPVEVAAGADSVPFPLPSLSRFVAAPAV